MARGMTPGAVGEGVTVGRVPISAFHGVRFPSPRLTVRENRAIKSLQDLVHDGDDGFVVQITLGRVGAEDLGGGEVKERKAQGW